MKGKVGRPRKIPVVSENKDQGEITVGQDSKVLARTVSRHSMLVHAATISLLFENSDESMLT